MWPVLYSASETWIEEDPDGRASSAISSSVECSSVSLSSREMSVKAKLMSPDMACLVLVSASVEQSTLGCGVRCIDVSIKGV